MASKALDFPALVKKGDYELLKEWLERVPNRMDRVALVNAASASGSTALFGVCWDGRTDLLELLVGSIHPIHSPVAPAGSRCDMTRRCFAICLLLTLRSFLLPLSRSSRTVRK